MIKFNICNLTSLLYVFPTVQAFLVHQTSIFKYGLLIVIFTSQLYHSTHHPVAKFIDMSLVHYMISYHVWRSLWCPYITLKVIGMYGSIVYAGLHFWFFKISSRGNSFHSLLHFLSAYSSYLFLSETNCLTQ